ncbi:DEAD/DEAH box helicase [Marinobacterium jannaschii]|uniref:DEAD/DEAH box helicase n=1 Tax=Marinobacterium jannaschii TaxID=64970 RepID=UPI0006888606|nr:DEAD/DEAH box helicase [Marinobacterium jannaschii]
MSFLDLQLDLELVQALAENGFTVATEIQQQAIPAMMDGLDLLASAPTGTGKTLAFVLPAVQHVLDRDERATNAPKVLILSPTRELARQTFQVAEQQCSFTSLTSNLIVGGVPYGMQQAELEQDCDILVATPGRLLELDEKGWLDLSDVSILVIDEADRMLDMGFIEPIRKIAALTPEKRQTAMFSATLESEKVRHLAAELLNDEAVTVEVSKPRAVASNIVQRIYRADNDDHKQALLKHLITQENVRQALVFVASRNQVDSWNNFIREQNLMCDGLHGELPQGERNLRLKNFRRGRLKVLVATDIAARGLDLSEISHVINLYLPLKGDIYVHRAGRAGRDGSTGYAYSIVDSNDWDRLGRIERYLGEPIRHSKIEGLEAKKKAPHRDPAKTKPKKKKASAAKSAKSSKSTKSRGARPGAKKIAENVAAKKNKQR